jgi:allantoicase
MTPTSPVPPTPVANDFTRLIDLAAERLGGVALAASDEFFAPKENLLKPGRGVFIPDKYTDRGKWMDGWETRRKRTPGHDWCLIRLGLPGRIRGLDVDTNHFTGNFPEHASLEACVAEREATPEALERAHWTELVPITRLQGGSQNLIPLAARADQEQRWTHVRLHIYPDGGVARLRVHGEVMPDLEKLRQSGESIDLAAAVHGGVVLVCNDMFFGPKDNLILPGPSLNMGDGWETKRKRGPGHDWVILRLGTMGTLRRVEVDTSHFKGNYPDCCSLDGARLPAGVPDDFLASRSIAWEEILPPTPLGPDAHHIFERELQRTGPFTHVRLNIYPDGGIARLRLYGVPA